MLTEPGRLGRLALSNRVIMTPMGLFGLPSLDGGLTDRGIEFYAERARGGAALVFPAAALVSTEFESPCMALYAFDSMERAVHWSRLAERVHAHGARLGIQLSAGLGRTTFNYFFDPGHVPVSASATACHWTPWIESRPLDPREIARLVAAFGTAAALARNCGIDVIEIHGYGGYLIDQFASEMWNRRTDAYGGSLQGRMRFALEVLAAVRASCGEGFPVVFKFTPVHGVEGGRSLEEGIEIAQVLEAAGADALHVDVGCYEAWHKAIPPVYEPAGAQVEIAAKVRAAVGVPVIAHGKLGDPELAEAVLRDGSADFIGLGRSLLADPEWVRKVAEGRPEDIVPCIGCSEGCMARGFSGRYASCAVNPACAMEAEFRLEPAASAKRVVVVGGGPGGLAAAITAARRGHSVTVLEKASRLGGCLVAAGAPAFKEDVKRFLDHLAAQVVKLGIDVRLSCDASAAEVLELRPDVAIIASGARPAVCDVPGIDSLSVSLALDVLCGAVPEGEKVLVAGAGIVGCETALHLAGLGKRVTVIDEVGVLSDGVFMLNSASLLEKMRDAAVETVSPAVLEEVLPAGAVVRAGESRDLVECDSIVLALGSEPGGEAAELASRFAGAETRVIGDAVDPRKVLDAFWEGFHAARLV